MSGLHRARWLIAVVAFALFGAACGGGEVDEASDEAATESSTTTVADDGGDDGTDAPATTGSGDEAPGTTGGGEVDCSQAEASDVGVTADTVTVGLISVDLEPLFGTGFVDENTPDNFFTRNFSLIHAINEAGGINCRQIELIQETYDPARSAETQVPACERMAQDNEIFVAIAAFPDSAGGGIDCMWERFGIPIVTSGPTQTALSEQSNGYVTAVRPSVEVMAATAAQRFVDAGLTEGEKVAVFHGDTGELVLGGEALVAALEALDVDVTPIVLPSSGGTTEVWGAAPSIVSSMVADDFTTVLMTGSSVTMGPYYNEMQSNGADWKWLVVDLQAAGGGFSAAKMPDDWTGTAVTSQLHEERTSEGDVECIEAYDLLKSSGLYADDWFEDPSPDKGNTNTTRPLSNDCALAKLIIVGLQNAGLNPTRDSFAEGLNNAGAIDIAFEADGELTPGKGYLSDTASMFTRYGPGSAECTDIGYFEELGCWSTYTGEGGGDMPNTTP